VLQKKYHSEILLPVMGPFGLNWKLHNHINCAGHIEINEILEHIGPLGRWQCIQSFFLLSMGAMGGVGGVIFALTGFVPNHRCVIPQCENLNSTSYNFMSSFNFSTVPNKRIATSIYSSTFFH
jgi:hypothetical protein